MKYVDKNNGREVELIPETEEDMNYLKRTYPHYWPFKSMTVALPLESIVPADQMRGTIYHAEHLH